MVQTLNPASANDMGGDASTLHKAATNRHDIQQPKEDDMGNVNVLAVKQVSLMKTCPKALALRKKAQAKLLTIKSPQLVLIVSELGSSDESTK